MRTLWLTALLIITALVARPAPGGAAPAVSPLQLMVVSPTGAGPAPTYAVVEFTVLLKGGSAPYANPYDPAEVSVNALATGPGGIVIRMPAFYKVPYARKTEASGIGFPSPVGGPSAAGGWCVRIAFPKPGRWTVMVGARDRSGAGADYGLPFTVTRGTDPGFVRRSSNPRYFELSNGAPYFIVGENVCWAGNRGLADFDDWFGALGKGGGNYARVWLAHDPLETPATGLGRYDQQNAAYYDEVLRIAQRDGIRCMLALGTYGDLSTGGFFNEGKWPVSPYNAANGGPAAKPEDFFTDPRAITAYKQRLRYLIARYSAFTSVGFWELWNEQGGPTPWFREMATYLKANDPYRHMVTNSYSTTGPAEVWNIPEIDLTQTHRYGDEGSLPDIAPTLPADARDHDRFAKPHLVGEFGISWRGGDEKYDPSGKGTNLHNGLWASALSGAAGGACIWYWDDYVAPKNLYSQFTGLARFAALTDWSHRDFQPLTVEGPRVVNDKSIETFHDLAVVPVGTWGVKSGDPVTIHRDGHVEGGIVPGFFYGPSKPELQSTLTLNVDLLKPSPLVLHIGTVSERAVLRVSVDGVATPDLTFETQPGKGADFESTKQFPEYGGIYQAVYNRDRSIPIPAGRHAITIRNVAGDWAAVGRFTLTGALSSRYIPLAPVALQDHSTGDTLVWLHDPDSNWSNDRDGKTPPAYAAGKFSLHLPMPRPGLFRVRWWDTVRGVVVSDKKVRGAGKVGMTLPVPAFTRDIALIVGP